MSDVSALGTDEIAAMIDQTLLKPTAGYQAAAAWMEGSREAGFATLCVSPFLVPLTAQRLAGTCTKVCTVIGFPLGYAATETKADEARQMVDLGAHEIDMVMNIGAFLEGDTQFVEDDIAAVVEAVAVGLRGDGLVKVILETGRLAPEQVGPAAALAIKAGADYVKTSTGFGPRGASVDDVRAMKAAVPEGTGIKAAGGIRDLAAALAMIEAGATRIGTSAGLEIVAGLPE